MKNVLRILAAVLLAGFIGSAGAAPLREGIDYELVNPPQPTERGKIEVIEFFSYACPHCAHFEPVLEKWAKALPKDVVLHRVPVIFRPQWEAPARLYYVLESLGQADRLNEAVFAAIHQQGIGLFTEAAVTDWAAAHGIDRKKFSDTYHSFTVDSLIRRSKEMTAAYAIPGVPTVAVAGRYKTPDNFAGSHEDMLRLVDALIAKARTERR